MRKKMKFQSVLTWAAVGLLGGCAGPGPTLATYKGGTTRETMAIGTWDRFYIVHMPTRANPGPLAPLVIAYHGLGQTAALLEQQTGLDEMADEAGFIVVYPEAALGQWDVTGDFVDLFGIDDIQFARQLIDRMSTNYVINKNRVFVAGLSNGAVFAQRLACEVTDQLAGFISVAGTLSRPARDRCAPSRTIAGLYIIGSEDTQFPVNGDDIVLSVDSTMQFWGNANHCDRRSSQFALPDTAHDNTHVFRSRFIDCASGGETELDSIAGGGHTWPGQLHPPNENAVAATSRNLSANDEIRRIVMGGRSRPR